MTHSAEAKQALIDFGDSFMLLMFKTRGDGDPQQVGFMIGELTKFAEADDPSKMVRAWSETPSYRWWKYLRSQGVSPAYALRVMQAMEGRFKTYEDGILWLNKTRKWSSGRKTPLDQIRYNIESVVGMLGSTESKYFDKSPAEMAEMERLHGKAALPA